MEIISTIITGAIAGWLGSLIFKGTGLGLFGNIIIGIVGSFVGNWSLGKFGISLGDGWIGAVLTAAIGAVIIIFLINVFLIRESSHNLTCSFKNAHKVTKKLRVHFLIKLRPFVFGFNPLG